MKIGIITLYNSINYGAFLQAYSLQKILKNIGENNVKFINFNNKEDRKLNFRNSIFAKRPTKLVFNIKRMNNYKKAHKKMLVSSVNYLNKKDQYDLIIIGSDEMWNITNSSFQHLPMFFGKDINANKIATYAISCGQATIKDLKNYSDCTIGIKNIEYLSGRDKNTVSIMKELSNKDVECVLDPTFLYDFNNEEETVHINDNYLLVYGYGFTKEEVNIVRQYAKHKNLVIVSAGFNHRWCDKSIPASPFGFLYLMKNAKISITNTFHGTLFSIIYRKNFVVLGDNKIKINDILNQLQLKSRVVNNYDELVSSLSQKIDYVNVKKLLDKKKIISINYLKNVLSSVEGNNND